MRYPGGGGRSLPLSSRFSTSDLQQGCRLAYPRRSRHAKDRSKIQGLVTVLGCRAPVKVIQLVVIALARLVRVIGSYRWSG